MIRSELVRSFDNSIWYSTFRKISRLFCLLQDNDIFFTFSLTLWKVSSFFTFLLLCYFFYALTMLTFSIYLSVCLSVCLSIYLQCVHIYCICMHGYIYVYIYTKWRILCIFFCNLLFSYLHYILRIDPNYLKRIFILFIVALHSTV